MAIYEWPQRELEFTQEFAELKKDCFRPVSLFSTEKCTNHVFCESNPEVHSCYVTCYISNMISFESDSDPGFDSCYKLTLINPVLDSDPGPDN